MSKPIRLMAAAIVFDLGMMPLAWVGLLTTFRPYHGLVGSPRWGICFLGVGLASVLASYLGIRTLHRWMCSLGALSYASLFFAAMTQSSPILSATPYAVLGIYCMSAVFSVPERLIKWLTVREVRQISRDRLVY